MGVLKLVLPLCRTNFGPPFVSLLSKVRMSAEHRVLPTTFIPTFGLLLSYLIKMQAYGYPVQVPVILPHFLAMLQCPCA